MAGEPFFEVIANHLADKLRESQSGHRAEFIRCLCGPIDHAVCLKAFEHTMFAARESFEPYRTGQKMDTSSRYILTWGLNVALTYCHEKIRPALNLAKKNGWLDVKGLCLLKDLSSRTFFTARNALAHWNFDLETIRGSIRLYSKCDNDKLQFDYIEWSYLRMLAARHICTSSGLALHLAVEEAVEQLSRS